MFRRDISLELEKRLAEPRHFIQIVSGPRQTGKTTAVKQAVKASKLPCRIATADSATQLNSSWIEIEWQQARQLTVGSSTAGGKVATNESIASTDFASKNPAGGKTATNDNPATKTPAVLVLDEVQKVKQWSGTVKKLWDEDSWNDTPLLVVILGSSSLLIQKGLNESLTGRFEMLRSTHWSLSETSEAFGYSFEDYLSFGGYPGAAALHKRKNRWLEYMRDSIIETTISRDVLQLEDVRKPALMRELFELGAQYSAQELSYRKILGQLCDKGNTDVIKHYLDLLSGAGMMSGLQKYDAKQIRTRKSSPRLMVHDTSLMTASWRSSVSLTEDPAMRGHLIESAVGSFLIAQGQKQNFEVFWWRDDNLEVDFVIRRGNSVTAIEVKSGRVKKSGIADFCKRYPDARPLVLGDINNSVEDFLRDNIPLF